MRSLIRLLSSLQPPRNDGIRHARGANVGLDVVDTDDIGPGGHSQRGRGERALQALIGGQVKHLADGRLATGSEEHRAPERCDQRQVTQHGQIVLWRLPEADAGIDDEVGPVDAGSQGTVKGTLQIGDHLRDDVAVTRF